MNPPVKHQAMCITDTRYPCSAPNGCCQDKHISKHLIRFPDQCVADDHYECSKDLNCCNYKFLTSSQSGKFVPDSDDSPWKVGDHVIRHVRPGAVGVITNLTYFFGRKGQIKECWVTFPHKSPLPYQPRELKRVTIQ